MTVPDAPAVTAAPIPTNAHPQSAKSCAKWYTVRTFACCVQTPLRLTNAKHKVKREEDCAKLSLANQISGTDFEFLNPSVGSQCSNLEAGFAYCVAPVGDISLYPGYHPTSTTSFTRTPRPTSTSTEDVYIPTNSPLAPGTLDKCYYYSLAVTKGSNLDYVNSCAVWAAAHRVEVSDLKEWNPSLTDQDCTFKPGYRYCVEKVQVPGKLCLSYFCRDILAAFV